MNTSYQQVSWNGKEDAGYEESFKKKTSTGIEK